MSNKSQKTKAMNVAETANTTAETIDTTIPEGTIPEGTTLSEPTPTETTDANADTTTDTVDVADAEATSMSADIANGPDQTVETTVENGTVRGVTVVDNTPDETPAPVTDAQSEDESNKSSWPKIWRTI